jgi:hypothetical protein
LSYYLKPIRFLSIKVLCRIFQSAKLHSKSLKKAACAKSVPNMLAQAILTNRNLTTTQKCTRVIIIFTKDC